MQPQLPEEPITIIMWLSDGLLTSIAGFLDFHGLRLLSSASKETRKTLLKEFRTKSHPHAVACIARRIMQERIRTPPPQWMTATVRDPLHLVRYADLDAEQTGTLMLFSTDITDDRRSLKVRGSYANSDEGFTTLHAFIEVTITPSRENPMRSGAVVIERREGEGDDESTTTTTDGYTDGFDPRRALEWCPVVWNP